MTNTTTQRRAICAACGKQHAVKGDRMVDHGYRVRWNQFQGNCYGARVPHFGTPEGRQVSADIATALQREAAKIRDNIAAGRIEPRNSKGEVIETPTPWQTNHAIKAAEYGAAQRVEEAQRIEQRVADWKPVEPVEVQVEKSGPVTHLRATYWRDIVTKACAGSVNAARQYAELTDDPAEVTCKRCRKIIEKKAS